MLVELRSLKPNPMRDFIVDPLDEDQLDDLKRSIKEDGFWGGVALRKTKDGTIEIAAGHRRIKAAIAAGVNQADLHVNEDMDNASMVRVYARENATQRGNSGTAQAGSVASALRLVARAVFTGIEPAEKFFSRFSLEELRRQIARDGIGRDVLAGFLHGVPGVNDGTIMQSLANLKASGNYARIIREVHEDIERENREAIKALEKAEREQKKAEEEAKKAEAERKEATARAKAAREEADKKRAKLEEERAEIEAKLAEKRRREAEEEMKQFEDLRKTRETAAKAQAAANGKARTFDFEGVACHFKNAHQIDVFRKLVTGKGISPYLAVEKQAELAQHLVALAEQRGKELTGAFIKENVVAMVLGVKDTKRKLDKEERARLEEADWRAKAKKHQDAFARNCRGMGAAGNRILELLKGWPKRLAFPITGEFRNALDTAKNVIDRLYKKV